MSITRITEGNHNTEIEGSWTVYTDTFEAFAGQFSHFTATEGTFLGNPIKAPIGPSNAYVPIINAINDENTMFKSYEIFINNKEEWVFNKMLDENLRRQKSHEIKFISNTQIHKIKFKVEKGNSDANDNDGGNITALYFKNGDTNSFETQIIKDVKYGDTFFLDWDCNKDISQVQFYANDNDLFFDGGIANIYCGAVQLKGSKVGRRLTKNIELSPVANPSQQLPGSHTFNFPEESFKVANKYQNPFGMCFAITMKRVEKAYLDERNISDALTVNVKHEDYQYSGTTTTKLIDKYFGYGVGGALAKNSYSDLVTTEEIWEGKLEEGAMIQYWNDSNEIGWLALKEEIKNALLGKNAPNFHGGHSVIFKYYIFDNSNKVIAIKFYDYAGIRREFDLEDKKKKIMMGANLKDKK